jgi:hypothetical protein
MSEEQGKKACFDSAAVVRGFCDSVPLDRGGKRLALGLWRGPLTGTEMKLADHGSVPGGLTRGV